VIQQVLAEARARIRRYTPPEAAVSSALLVDTRSTDERTRDGVIPGSVHVPLSVLEWRADQSSGFANRHLAGRTLILVCAHGCSSSLAAARLAELGVEAGDVDGGFDAWRDAGLPVISCNSLLIDDGLPGMGGPQ
jgi:rhodanese-related sulfurtransferase